MPSMRIAYIILTCEAYDRTRRVWQRQTSLCDVPKQDLYYLSYKMDPSHRLFSWGAHDGYMGLPFKMIDFFKHMYLDYDWYVLMDDDTYIYTERLQSLLSTYSSTDSLAIGHLLTHLQQTEWGSYFSGGAGTVLSRTAYDALYRAIHEAPHMSHLALHWCADISLGLWLRTIPVQWIHHAGFHPEMNGDVSTAITLHHVKHAADYARCFAGKN